MRKQYNQLGIGAILSYAAIAANILLGIVYTPWMIDVIGQSDFGLYTLANSLISLFMIDIGLGTAASRYVAKYRAQGREVLISGLLGAVYKLYLILDGILLLGLLILYFCIDLIYVNLTPAELVRFKVVFAIAGVYSVFSFPCTTFNGILNAYEQFVPLKAAELLQRIGSVVLTVGALRMGLGLYALVLIQAVSGCTANLIKYLYVRRQTSIRFIKTEPGVYDSIFSISFWSCIHGLAQRLVFNITPTILAITVMDAALSIAIFGVVSTIEGYCYILTTAINGMFLSRISRILQGADSEKALNSLAIKVGRFQFALNGLVILGFTLVGREFLCLWMGSEFKLAYYGVLFVTIPGMFYNALQIFHTTMVARNMVKDQAMIQIAMGVINVGLSFWLSHMWGVVGATLSIFVAYSFRVIMTLLLVKKKLKIDLAQYFQNCYVKMGVAVLLTGLVALPLLKCIGDGSWLLFFVKVVLVTLLYGIVQVCVGLTKDERNKLKSKLMRFL